MNIMSAGMHDTLIPGFIVHLILLLYWQCIHIGPQSHDLPTGVLSADLGQYSGPGNPFSKGDLFLLE